MTADQIHVTDIGISGGTITAVAPSLPPSGGHEIEAEGKLVIPGAVDVHTHFANTIGGITTADDYESGSRAAACGGITTFVNVAFQEHGESLRATAEAELAKARGQSYLDYGVHLAITDPDAPGVLDEIGSLADEGFASVKVFTAVPGLRLSDHQLLRVLEQAGRERILVNVHAEDHDLVEYLTRRLLDSGATAVSSLPLSRPTSTEAIATFRTAYYAAAVGCAVYFVHLSSGLALDAVRSARNEGAEAYVETRPAYLFLDQSRYALPVSQGNNYVCWPPLRDVANQDALWQGLSHGEIQTYATDHTTYLSAQKMDRSLTFAEVPGGVSNVQTSVGMLYGEGVRKKRITLRRFVEVTASNPAKLFGLWPSKGVIRVGSDADIVLLDPDKRVRITTNAMESKSDFEPYDGYEATGWPTTVIAGGRVLVDDGKFVGHFGSGAFIRRTRYQPLALPMAGTEGSADIESPTQQASGT